MNLASTCKKHVPVLALVFFGCQTINLNEQGANHEDTEDAGTARMDTSVPLDAGDTASSGADTATERPGEVETDNHQGPWQGDLVGI